MNYRYDQQYRPKIVNGLYIDFDNIDTVYMWNCDPRYNKDSKVLYSVILSQDDNKYWNLKFDPDDMSAETGNLFYWYVIDVLRRNIQYIMNVDSTIKQMWTHLVNKNKYNIKAINFSGDKYRLFVRNGDLVTIDGDSVFEFGLYALLQAAYEQPLIIHGEGDDQY